MALEPNQDDDFFLTGLSGDMSPRASDVEFFVRVSVGGFQPGEALRERERNMKYRRAAFCVFVRPRSAARSA